jgi:predicted MPP superfamily phosphohydrolase
LVRAELHNSRIIVLENENVLIVPGQQPFYLLGVDYPWADSSYNGINVSANKRQQYFAAANRNIPINAFKVLIAHHPDCLIDGFAAQIPLTLAGHTHGGQVVIGGKPLLNSYAYMRGLYQENGNYGYVNSGAGQWFPFRLGCPPEISIFTMMS